MSTAPHFNGPEYSPRHDQARLMDQHQRIRALMLDGVWRTIQEIARLTGDPQASVSAQLRHLRKERFGGFVVDRQKRGDRAHGLFEYRVRESMGPLFAEPRRLSRKQMAERIAELERQLVAARHAAGFGGAM
jgi:hypothetical protein